MSETPEVIRDYLNYTGTIKGKSKNTIKEYYYDLRMFFRFILMHKGVVIEKDIDKISIENIDINIIKSITLSDLYSFISYTSRERDNTASARARKVACIRSFFNFITDKAKLLEYNPASQLESPKILKKLPKYLNIDESKRLLSSVDGENKERDYAILVIFLNCGLRLSELAGININDIKIETLTVVGKGSKERTIYLNKAVINAINSYSKVRPVNNVKDQNALFLSERRQRISVKTVQYIVKKYIKLAGLDPVKYSTHKLRHTAATLMYKHGNVDIRALQQILGHESISTTEIYTHVDNSQLKRAVESNPLADFNVDKSNS